SLRRESEHRHAAERFTGTQDGRRKIRMIDRVGEMLRLEADRAMFEMVATVKLKAGFSRAHLHDAAARRVKKARRQSQGFSTAIQNEVMIVTARLFQLFNVSANRS